MKPVGKILGIDFGTKKSGLAVSDHERRVAFPYCVLPTNAEFLDIIAKICRKEEIAAAVIGESRDYAGRPNPLKKKTDEFKLQLELKTGLRVFYEPEFLTSKQARNILDSGEKNDASAAALILQSWLDRKVHE